MADMGAHRTAGVDPKQTNGTISLKVLFAQTADICQGHSVGSAELQTTCSHGLDSFRTLDRLSLGVNLICMVI